MGTHFKEGFTIIETMLVLAITGTLAVALLVGVGTSINAQRYRDSVISLKGLLQDQYAELNNVRNDRQGQQACGVTNNGTAYAGQSDCLLMGRYVGINDEGRITTATVIGYESSKPIAATDVGILRDSYTLGLATNSIEEAGIEWGATITWPVSGGGSKPEGTPRSLAFLILRSPQSGNMYTFTGDTAPIAEAVSPTFLKSLVVEGVSVPGQSQRTVCVSPTGVAVAEKLAIYIVAGANNTSGIETRSYQTILDAGGDSKC